MLLILIPVLVVLFFVIRFIYRHTIGKKLKTTVIEDYQKEAEVFEKAGSYVSAAGIYEKKLRDYHKAALLYEKGKDYTQVAVLYDVLGMSRETKEMWEKAVKVLQEIEQVNSAFKDVQQRIENLMPPEEIPEGKTLLRSFKREKREKGSNSFILTVI